MNRRSFLSGVSSGALAYASVTAHTLASSEDVFQPIRDLLSSKEPAIWLFTGDSVTHGALHTMGWRSYPEHFAERVRWELQRRRDVVINTGVSGNTVEKLLPDLEWRVFRFRPSLVSLMYGMNDCRGGSSGREPFRRNLQEIVTKVRDAGALPLLHTPNAIYLPTAGVRKDLGLYVEVIREFSAQAKVSLVDHYAHWLGIRREESEICYWLSDGSIHPNQYGHIAMAKLIFEKLGIFDSQSRTCQLYVP